MTSPGPGHQPPPVIPSLLKTTLFATVVPFRFRRLHRGWAGLTGGDWLPCALCRRDWGEHETLIDCGTEEPAAIVLPAGPGMVAVTRICPACARSGLHLAFTTSGEVPDEPVA